MNIDQLSRNFKEGERLVRVVRRDVLAELPRIALGCAVVLIDFFLLWFFIRHRPWGLWAFVLMLLVGLVIGIRALVEWRLNVFIVTTVRIIHMRQKGFFSRTVAETTLGKITDVRFGVRGVLQTALSLGSVEVQTAGEGENMKLEGVRRPHDVQHLISDLMQNAKQRADGSLSAEELVAAITRAKRELGPEAFRRVVNAEPTDEDPAEDG